MDETNVTTNKAIKTYRVKKIFWSPCSKRIAVIYQTTGNSNQIKTAPFVHLLAFDFGSCYRLGFLTHPHGTYPINIIFRNHFNNGALMAICWNNAVISQHHLCFNTKTNYYQH